MVKAEVHGGEALVPNGRHLLAHEQVGGEVEAGLGRHPRQGNQEQKPGKDEAKRVTARMSCERDAAATGGGHGQREREPDTEGRQRVDPPRIEVVLVDDARERGQQAEADREPDEQPRPARDCGKRDGRNRKWIVEQDEGAAETGGEVARLVDVVQRLGLQPRVGDEYRGRLEPEQRPGGERLALA